MGIRDDELNRMIKYIEGLGLKFTLKRHTRGKPGATWDTDGGEIELFYWPGQSKIKQIMLLLHELGHHMDWIYSGKVTSKEADDAYNAEEPVPKEQRKIIYNSECDGIQYMIIIARELNLKIPENKILMEMALDEWIYYKYYITGKLPIQTEIKEKRKALKKEYK